MGKQKYKSFKVFLNRHLCLSKGRICGIVAAVTISLSLLQFSAKQTSFQKSRGPPPTFQVQPKYASYTKVPEKSRRTYYVDTHTKYKATAIRALRNIGWRRTNDYETAQLIWDKTMDSEYFSELKAWQRYNHIPGVESWDDKDNFIEGFEQYLRKNPEKKFMMLPETYKISTQQGIRDWRKRLFQHSGMDIPWVLKQTDVNNGEGIDILGPNSKELKDVERDLDHQNATEDGTYVVQAYICNELTWWGNFKFDLRYYWLVASLDPLVVLYHDGFVRVGNSAYSESDFSSTTKHLTTHTYLPDEIKAPADDLARLIRQHYQKNYRKLSKTIKIDPYEHVRNQLKEAVAETVAAFKHVTFRTDTKDGKFTAENGFVIYGIGTCIYFMPFSHRMISLSFF